jgi:hypothetical protein
MITPLDCINLVYTLLSARPLHKHAYPDSYDAEFFTVINTLGVPADPIQTVELNVNSYAKDLDLQRGIPDLTKLNTMVTAAINELHDYHYNGIDIELTMSNILREESINCHYINLRFKIIYTSN